MLTKAIYILSLLAVVISCSSDPKSNNNSTSEESSTKEEKPQEQSEQQEVSRRNGYSFRDTILNDGYKFEIDFLTWSRDEADLSQYGNIERKGDSLIFTTAKSKVSLVNIEYDEDKQNFDAPDYKLFGLNKKANVAIVQVSTYEYWYHVLVDMYSGDTISIYGKPLFTKDNSTIIASNVDLETQFTENGFQIIKKDSEGFKLIYTELLLEWGIARASWIGNNQLIIDKATVDEKYDMHFKPGVLQFDIKEM